MARVSWLASRGSWLVARGSWPNAHGSRPLAHGHEAGTRSQESGALNYALWCPSWQFKMIVNGHKLFRAMCSCDGRLRSVLLAANSTDGHFGSRLGASLRSHIAETHPPFNYLLLLGRLASRLIGWLFGDCHPPTSLTSRRSPARHCGLLVD